jgi:phenylalanyl-tRNA synthetase beta chain
LKNYVRIPWQPKELADRLTLGGVAVDAVDYRAERLSGVYAGAIVELSPHPNANKLQICRLDMGSDRQPLTIVTGATNVFVGARVPVAVDGAELPIGQEIYASDFRGVLSQGMLCSAEELGLPRKVVPPEMRDGIYLLPDDVPLGADIRQVMQLSDYLLELDLTPNRSDCLSMLGTAYEVAALCGETVKLPALADLGSVQTHDAIRVQVADPDLCPGYLGLVIENVQIGPSPLWMQNALQAADLRPINNLVDITNYILLELGQPLHAFDLDQLQGSQIVVRRATADEQIVTLDDVTRNLDQDMLVIADAERAVGIAGVMGGAETEVKPSTRRVFLESAWFKPESIRRTSRRLGLRTDASSRFDKGIDPARAIMALQRAAQLVQQLGCGQPDTVMVGELHASFEQRISLRPERVNQLLGTDISEPEMLTILQRLGLSVSTAESPWLVIAPSRRPDLVDEIDLVEEIARLHGYDRIPVRTMSGPVLQGGRTPRQQMIYQLRQFMLGFGLDEVVSMSFINPETISDVVGADHEWNRAMRLQNPLTKERSVMRPSLLFGLLDTLSYNVARQQNDLAVFELANVFMPLQQGELCQPEEPLHLALAASGQAQGSWQRNGIIYDFFYIKGLLEGLLRPYGICLEWQAINDVAYLHPGRAARVFWHGQALGVVGELHPNVMEQFDLRKRAIIAEINLEPVLNRAGFVPIYQGMPRFPGVERDLAVTVDESIPAERVAECIREAAGELLVELRLFDVYQGEQVAAGKKSMAYALTLQSPERTLQEEDIAALHTRVLTQLAQKLSALLR